MQVAFLDFPPVIDDGVAFTFPEPASLDAADLVVWRPAAIAEVYPPESSHEGVPVLGVLDSQRAFSHTRFWRREFQALLARGGTLVVFAPDSRRLGLHTVQDVVGYDTLEALPDHLDLPHGACEPSAVACAAGQPFRDFFDAFGRHFVATTEFRPLRGVQPIATLAGTSRICGVYQYRHPGRLLVLPTLRDDTPAETTRALVGALTGMAAGLRFDGRAASSYLWPTPLHLPEEDALRRERAQVAAQRRVLQAQEDDLAQQISRIAFLRQLHCGDAAGALDAAMLVLHALGAYAQHGAGPADTLMFEFGGNTGVLVTLDDAQVALGARLPDHVGERAAAWATELRAEVVPIGFYVGGNRRGVEETSTELAALRQRHPALRFVSGAELHAAYASRDAGVIAQGLAPASASAPRPAVSAG